MSRVSFFFFSRTLVYFADQHLKHENLHTTNFDTENSNIASIFTTFLKIEFSFEVTSLTLQTQICSNCTKMVPNLRIFLKYTILLLNFKCTINSKLAAGNYLKGRDFRGKKISRIFPFLIKFVKLNSRENCSKRSFTKLNSRENRPPLQLGTEEYVST